MDSEQWKKEDDWLRYEYDRAYFRSVFCPESEQKKADELLKIWRHKYFSH